jgi:UDP-glucuronate decarboxylase
MAAPSEVVTKDLDYICGALEAEFAQMAGSRLLIVGGAGFLGHYLVQAVLHWNAAREASRHIEVVVYDSYVRGVPAWLQDREADPTLTLVKHDIRDPLPEGIGDFQYVIHGGSIASPTYYRRRPIETMDANVNGLRRLLDYFLELKQAGKPLGGFLFFSSSEIYGDPDPESIPTREDYRGLVSCTGPRACYDESKRYGETLCVNFAAQHELPISIARPFNNYGPGLKISDRRVIPDFAREILAGRDVTMLSDGSPRRTFCYVADAVVGYYKVLVRGGRGESYNVGVEEPEISMLELAEQLVEMASELLGYRGRVVRKQSDDADYLVDNPNRRCPQIGKARRELGYDPQIDLREGLRRTLLWYRENPVAEDL